MKVEGPRDHQAAMAMGNSERAWTAFYDKNYQKRECQAGIQAMAAWRSSMLDRPGPMMEGKDPTISQSEVIVLDD